MCMSPPPLIRSVSFSPVTFRWHRAHDHYRSHVWSSD
jgi:hypothetical protein